MKSLKKISLIFILMTIILLLLTITSRAATKIKVTGDTINIRKGPSTSTSVVAMLFKGVECDVLGEEDGWYKIKYKSYTGYVSKEYVEVIGESTSKKEDENTNNQVNNATNSNVNSNNNNTSIENNVDDTKNETNVENNLTVEQNSIKGDNVSSVEQDNEKTDNDNIQIVYKKLKENSTLKILPLIYSSNIEDLKKNTEVVLLAEITGWSYIQTDNSCGWIRTDYLEASKNTKIDNESDTNSNEYTEKTAYISESSVNMRKGTGTSYNIIKVLSLNTQLTIIGEEGTWYKVKVGSTTGYVSKDYVSDTKTTTTRGNNNLRNQDNEVSIAVKKENVEKNTVKVENTVSTTVSIKEENTTKVDENDKSTVKIENKIKGTDVVAYAKKYLGYKYVYGGDGSNGTFDCSGFTMYVYKHFGIKIPHGANAQYNYKKGKRIANYSDLQVGDIVMLTDYETGVGIGHCGIYIGNDNFIHASTTCNAVEISSFKTIYKGRFYAGLRLI